MMSCSIDVINVCILNSWSHEFTSQQEQQAVFSHGLFGVVTPYAFSIEMGRETPTSYDLSSCWQEP